MTTSIYSFVPCVLVHDLTLRILLWEACSGGGGWHGWQAGSTKDGQEALCIMQHTEHLFSKTRRHPQNCPTQSTHSQVKILNTKHQSSMYYLGSVESPPGLSTHLYIIL